MIIDSHLHLPSVGDEKDYKKSKRKLLNKMGEAGVDYAIVIPDNIEGSDIGDLDTLLKLTKNEDRLFTLGVMDVKKQGSEWLQRLERELKKGQIRGIKIFPGHEPIYPTDKRYKPLYKLCQKYDCPLVIHTGPNVDDPEAAEYNDPKYIVKIAQEFPGLKIIIAHYFWPRPEYCYNITKGFDNIYFDTSALADKEVIAKTGEKTIKRVLEKTIADSPRSVLFGTDFSMCSFEDHKDLINSLNISDKERKRVFWKNAVDLFSLGGEISL